MSIVRFFYKKDSLKRKILDIKVNIKELIQKKCTEKVFITWYGAYEIDPKYLVFWICIKSDKTKTELQNDIELNANLRNLLVKYNYPPEAQNLVYISFESQETVDRESNGNWYHHFK
jgi:hypothetical protein